MRYLNFSNTSFTCLPEQIGDLLNLQSLMLCGCRGLSTLPKSIVKLLNLRHLGITDTPKLKNMPSGLGGLFCLQTLSKVVIGGADKFSICDIKGLLYLEGQLSIEGMHNVKNSLHAREANLQQKKGICDLRMEWSYGVLGDHQNEINDFEVLEGLRPFEKLTSLKIVNYIGTKFPSWIGDPSFVCLNQLALHGCIKCTCLPTLGLLPSLQKLYVESMERLKNLGSELLGPSNSFHSPSLEILEFKEMKSWEEWSTSGGEKAISFPCLHEISIIDCPKLDVVAIDSIPSLRVLHVQRCSLAVLKSMVGVSSSISRLKICNIKGLTWLQREVLDHIREVEDLEISKCVDLTYLWESEAATCKIPVNLQKLLVRRCANLVSFGEKEMNPSTSMESFKEVIIECCPRLESYNCPNSIEKLVIEECRSITLLGFPAMDGLPSALKNLEIRRCGNLEASWFLNNFLHHLNLSTFQGFRI
ncbi:putative leucine-rich repeat domain superfamily [Helianthus annuus]|nr:putative leucine-rich repeat domain superfamily [Helianthus annuus]